MSKIDWWNDGSKSSDWAMAMLPVLVRQAASGRPLTYSALARELGMSHHRPVQRSAGLIAYALDEISAMRGWQKNPPPPLQSLIINKQTGLPGHGVDGFMSLQYRQAKTKKQREAALLGVHGRIYSYPLWREVMHLLDVEPADTDLDELSDEATDAAGIGGEGPEHKALKEYIAAHPNIVGIVMQSPGAVEYPLPSGDRVDVVFKGDGWLTAVEVKSHISGRDDIARGIYQCVKYRAVLEARSSVSDSPFDVSVTLALGGSLPPELLKLANSFAIKVVDGIIPKTG